MYEMLAPFRYPRFSASLSPSLRLSLSLLFLSPFLSARRKQIIFVTQVFATVSLSKTRNARRIQPSRLGGAPRRDAKAQRRVVHAVHHDALVLGAVVGPAAHVCLDNVAAVQKGHLAVGFHPNLVPGVLGQNGQRGNVQAEFARLGELAEADAERDELFAFCCSKKWES